MIDTFEKNVAVDGSVVNEGERSSATFSQGLVANLATTGKCICGSGKAPVLLYIFAEPERWPYGRRPYRRVHGPGTARTGENGGAIIPH